MSARDEFWVAHDHQRQRVNSYLTVALDQRFEELLAMVRADLRSLTADDQVELVIGLVGALSTLTEQAADAGGVAVEEFWQGHVLDVEEMIGRRRPDDPSSTLPDDG